MIDDTKVDTILKMQSELASLEQRARELSACLTAMTLVGSSLVLDEVLDRAIESAKEVMNAEAASIMLVDVTTGELFFKQASGSAADSIREIRIPRGHGIAGWVAESGESLVVADAQSDPRFFRGADDKTGFVTRSILAVPLRVRERIIGVAEAINKRDGTFQESDLPLFTAYASLAAVAIENARMHSVMLEQEVVAREIDIARQIQESLQGPEYARVGHWLFNAMTAPARSVGGDFYDWIPLGDGRVLVVIGDVSGKGIPAALLMSNTISRLRAEAARLVEPREVLSVLNRVLCQQSRRGLFVTFFAALLEPDGHFHYGSAGHHPPMLFRAGRCQEMPKQGGPPLGIVPDFAYEQTFVRLEEDDVVMLYTDGVTEALSASGEFFGCERAEEVVNACQAEPETIARAMRHAVERFEAGRERTDDMTVAVIVRSSRAATFAHRYENLSVDDLGRTRNSLDDYLTGLGLDEKIRSRIILSVDEALTNVIRHAYGGEGGPAELNCHADKKTLTIEIRDAGCGRVPEFPREEPRELRPGGLGLVILKEVMDDVRFESSATGGCILRMKKNLEVSEKRS